MGTQVEYWEGELGRVVVLGGVSKKDRADAPSGMGVSSMQYFVM